MLARTPSTGRGSERLAERRRNRRRRGVFAFGVLLLLLFGAAIYGLQQNAVRISRVEILGTDPAFISYATNAMQGGYLGIIPRDSVFFFPEGRIRADILATHQDIAGVSISSSGFTGIVIKVDYRVPIARWCGLSPSVGVDEYCYIFDSLGFIFSAFATTTETINNFRLYASLEGAIIEPLRATIVHAEKLPSVFDFARQLATFGSSVTSIVIHGDEVDMYLTSGTPSTKSDLVLGTRVSYVLGNEQNAFTALVSARDNFNLSDGSVDYIDLRFDGKV